MAGIEGVVTKQIQKRVEGSIIASQQEKPLRWADFLPKYRIALKSLSLHREPFRPITHDIGVFGTNGGMLAAEQTLKGITDTAVITQFDANWKQNKEKGTAKQSEYLAGDTTALTYINVPAPKVGEKTRETGIISHAEEEAACSVAVLKGKPVVIRLEVPTRIGTDGGSTENEIYRARVMTLLNIIHTKIIYGEQVPIFVSTNFHLGEPFDNYINYIDGDTEKKNPATKAFIEKKLQEIPQLPMLPDYKITPVNTMVIFGSSWPQDITLREQFTEEITAKHPDITVTSTFYPGFGSTVESIITGRLQELDAIAGTNVTEYIHKGTETRTYAQAYPTMYPPRYTVAQVTDESFGTYQPFVRAATLSLLNSTNVFLFAPMHAGDRNIGVNSAAASFLRRLGYAYPVLLANLFVAQKENIADTKTEFFQELALAKSKYKSSRRKTANQR